DVGGVVLVDDRDPRLVAGLGRALGEAVDRLLDGGLGLLERPLPRRGRLSLDGRGWGAAADGPREGVAGGGRGGDLLGLPPEGGAEGRESVDHETSLHVLGAEARIPHESAGVVDGGPQGPYG